MKNAKRKKRFDEALHLFPEAARPLLEHLPQAGGRLSPTACQELIRILGVSMDALMIRLLPVAAAFSVAPISEFQVGAVALTAQGPSDRSGSLFLGANMEFKNLALNATVHAEQAAVINAWHQESGVIKAMAVSSPPCGHCRQFLNELFNRNELPVLIPAGKDGAHHRYTLPEIFPAAFPSSEISSSGLMAPFSAPRKLRLTDDAIDPADSPADNPVGSPADSPVVLAALSAAADAYAPYTGNLAGCAIETADHCIYSGRYLESAAYNPSVSPLLSAILRLNLASYGQDQAIDRIALVEKPTRTCQKGLVIAAIESWNPQIEFQYHIAEEEK